MAKLGLGTVQLGVPYGNKSNSPLMDFNEAKSIVDIALDAGIDFFDTAINYGESETRLGALNLAGQSPNSVISTKMPSVDRETWSNPDQYFRWICTMLDESNLRLKIDFQPLLQFHQCDVEFLSSSSIRQVFQRLIDQKIVGAVGLSIYTEEQAAAALECEAATYLQVPVNLVDTRFLRASFLRKAANQGVRLMARSAFLQGLLVPNAPLPAVKRSEELKQLKTLALDAASKCKSGGSLEHLAMRFLFANHGKDLEIVLIGVDSAESLRHNLSVIKGCTSALSADELAFFEPARQFAANHDLLNPVNWL